MEPFEDIKYIPHKSKANDKSSVWYYFLVSAGGGPTAQCKSCNKVLKTCFGSTKGLLTHLKVHKIELERKPVKPPLKMPAKRSLTWRHFKNVGEKRAMCKYCSAQISYNGGSVGNLSRHIKLKHSLISEHVLIPDDEKEGKRPDEQVEQIEQAPQSEQQSQGHQQMHAKRSRIWNNFNDVGAKRAMCKHCSVQISYNGGSVGNLSRHMKLKHPLLRWHNLILHNEDEGNIPYEQLDQIEQPKTPKVPPLKPKYEIIDGIIAPSSPIRSNNPSPVLVANTDNLYEKQIEFVDGYLGQDPFVNEDSEQSFAPRPPKIAKQGKSYQNKPTLEELRTRAEIQLMRAKTVYFRKQIDNLDIERSVMLLKVKKLEFEVEKLRNEARGSTWPTDSNDGKPLTL